MQLELEKHSEYKLLKSAVEGQKGVNDIQRCSVENHKGAIAVQVYGDSALLVLKGVHIFEQH